MLKSRGEACLWNAMDVIPSLTSIWGVSRGLQRAWSSYSHGVSFLAWRKLSWWKIFFDILSQLWKVWLLSEELNLPRDNQCLQYSRRAVRALLSHNTSNNYMTCGNSHYQGKDLPQNSTEETNIYVKYILTYEIVGSMKEL